MRSRFIVVLGGILLASVGCTDAGQLTSSSDASGSTVSQNTTASAAADTTTADTSRPDTSVGQGDEAAVGASSMVGLLESIPLAAYEAALASGSSSVELELADYSAASQMAGLERPPTADLDASLDWLFALSSGQPAADGGTGFAINAPHFPDLGAAALSDEVAAELGFSILDLDRSAVLTSLPVEFAVVGGAGLELSPDLVDVGNGVLSAGTGADFDSDLATRTPARPLGRPLRLASIDGTVAASLSTPAVASWLAGGPTMLDVDQFAIAAEALDAAGTTGAYLIESDFLPFDRPEDPEQQTRPAGFSAPFELVGIGSTMVDGRAANAIVYVFADDATAAATQPELDAAWRTGELVSAPGLVMSDYYEVLSVDQRGRAVLVTAVVSAETTTLRALQLMFGSEPVFSNS